MSAAIEHWHKILKSGDPNGLDDLIADECMFWSPAIHKPQEGKAMTKFYLSGAFHVLVPNNFHYVREVIGEQDAVLEFKAEIDGITINGVDMITWNEDNKITDFKVMIRPYSGLEKLKEKMAELLAKMKAA